MYGDVGHGRLGYAGQLGPGAAPDPAGNAFDGEQSYAGRGRSRLDKRDRSANKSGDQSEGRK